MIEQCAIDSVIYFSFIIFMVFLMLFIALLNTIKRNKANIRLLYMTFSSNLSKEEKKIIYNSMRRYYDYKSIVDEDLKITWGEVFEFISVSTFFTTLFFIFDIAVRSIF